MDILFSIEFYFVLFFIILFICLGLFNKNNSLSDYFSAGKNTNWYIAMFSIVATETSVLTFVSIPGLAYRDNWFFLQLSIGYIVGRILVSKILLPLYFSNNVTSIYELIGKRYDSNLQKLSSIIFLITRIFADGIRFLATASIVQILTAWPLIVCILLIGIVTLLYTVSGGLKAIMIIDSVQFLVYLFGGIMVIGFILFSDTFSGIDGLIQNEKLVIFKFYTDSFSTDSMFIFNAILGGIFLSFASHGVDYMMVQRALACKSLKSAQKAMIGSGFFVLLQFTIFLFAGSLIWEYMGGVELEKDTEFSTFIMLLPVVIKSIILVGVLSAAMSTLSSSINSLASSTVIDIFNRKVSLKKSKLISFFWASILILIAILFDESNTAIVIIGLKIASFTYGGLLGIFLISYINNKITSRDIIFGLISSVAMVFYLSSTNIAWVFYIFISLLTFIVISNLIYYSRLIVASGFNRNTIRDIIYIFLWLIMSTPLILVFYNMLLEINNINDIFMMIIFLIITIQLYKKLYFDLIFYIDRNYE